jgi:hypothetical protein
MVRYLVSQKRRLSHFCPPNLHVLTIHGIYTFSATGSRKYLIWSTVRWKPDLDPFRKSVDYHTFAEKDDVFNCVAINLLRKFFPQNYRYLTRIGKDYEGYPDEKSVTIGYHYGTSVQSRKLQTKLGLPTLDWWPQRSCALAKVLPHSAHWNGSSRVGTSLACSLNQGCGFAFISSGSGSSILG